MHWNVLKCDWNVLEWSGSRTPCHYDMFQNFYQQVIGRKRFLLIAPSAHAKLALYPAIHPAHRSAQLRVRKVDSAATSIDSAATSGPTAQQPPPQHLLEAMEVVLEPGEVLYIPAMWFHQVETLDELAVSVNVWSQYHPVTLADQLLNDVYLPCVISQSSPPHPRR
jgi:ribosomal protein L16 Arg81 hydroxylase